MQIDSHFEVVIMKVQPLCSATPLWQVLLLEDPGFLKSAFWNSDDPILATVFGWF